VDLNPGPGWWAPGTGHYQLQVLSRPATGVPGRVSVAIVLPPPELPQSVHDVTVDNTMSHPVDVQHSWTYPGLGCGALIRPQFSVSVLYAQAQNLAFAQARSNPKITGPLIKAAEAQAAQIIRNNFVQPTVNALGYTLAGFTIRWSADSSGWAREASGGLASDGQVGFDPPEVVAGQGQVGLGTVEDQVEEQALLVAGVLEQPDQVVLLAEGDQDTHQANQ
jgi:hypothetical protein